MPTDRAVEDLPAAVAQLQAELADLRSTAMARLQTGMTGDIEPTVRSTPKAGTLLLQGQTVLRADYPALWQWVQDQSLDGVAGLFGNGNGSTTFTLPDMRGRFIVGAGTLGSDSYAVGATGGAARVNQSIAQMARHSHSGVSSSDGAHLHTGGTSGSAAAHTHAMSGTTGATPDHAHTVGTLTGSGGSHFHAQGDTGSGGGHSHTTTGRWTASTSHNHDNNGAAWAEATSVPSGTATYGTSEMPNHIHDMFDTPSAGAHSHTLPSAAAGGGHSHSVPDTASGGAHTHTLPNTGTAVAHGHGIPLDGGTSGGSGPGASMDVRPPFIAVNWLIWT